MRRALQRMDRLVSSYKVGEYESVYIPFQCRGRSGTIVVLLNDTR